MMFCPICYIHRFSPTLIAHLGIKELKAYKDETKQSIVRQIWSFSLVANLEHTKVFSKILFFLELNYKQPTLDIES